MKKFLSICLLAALLLSLCACGAAGQSAETTAAPADTRLQVGYGKVDITPNIPLPLQGYGNTEKRISTGYYDPLYATCFAVTDAEGNTAILLGIDMGATTNNLYTQARKKISEKHGVPLERVIISASHTHSAPDMGNTNVAGVGTWTNTLIKLLVECADEAMADRAPADMYVTSTQTEGLNFVRRYALEDGTVNGYESIIRDSGLAITGHETEADHTLQLLKFLLFREAVHQAA